MSVKIAISGHGKKVSVKFKDNEFDSCFSFMKRVAALIEDSDSHDADKESENVCNTVIPFDNKDNAADTKDFVRGTKRLPNTSIVDVSTIDLKKAIAQETLIRCPFCGQSHCTIIGTHQNVRVLLKKKHNGKNSYYPAATPAATGNKTINDVFSEFTIAGLIRNKRIKEEHLHKQRLEFYNLMSNVNVTDEDFNADADTRLLCPVCGKESTLSVWVDAYVNPLKYFETGSLCEACGGELVDCIENDSVHGEVTVAKCEVCGHVMK